MSIFSSLLMATVLCSNFIGCNKNPKSWNGTIKEENGIVTVRNAKRPIYKKADLVLEEELTIGAEGTPTQEMLSNPWIMDVDSEGRIYVLDSKESRIVVFDGSGAFLRFIGRKGQGPGELDFPLWIQWTPDGRLLVSDSLFRRIRFFSPEGECLNEKVFSNKMFLALKNPLMDSRGNIVGIESRFTDVEPTMKIVRCDGDLNKLQTFSSRSYPKYPIIDPLSPWLLLMPHPRGGFVWADENEYALHIIDESGKEMRIVRKDSDPPAVTEAEKKQEMEQQFGKEGPSPDYEIVWKKRHNPIDGFTVDDEGHLVVGTHEKTVDGKIVLYDIFDPEGRFLAKIPLKTKPVVWKNGKLYTMEEDDSGMALIKRYKYSWRFGN